MQKTATLCNYLPPFLFFRARNVRIKSSIIEEKECIRYHLRCKGTPKESLEEACKKYDNDYIKMYEALMNGESIEFDLMASGVKFKFNKDFTVSNITEFKRNIII